MKGNGIYAREKLAATRSSLATGKGPIKDRLFNACISQFFRLEADDFPSHLQDDYKSIDNVITSVTPTDDEGSIFASIARMSDEEAQDIAQQIVTLTSMVETHMEEN